MKLLIAFFTFLVCLGAWGQQNEDFPNRDITVRILNKKGRPVRGIVVQSPVTGKAGITDRSGRFVFMDMADNDTILLKMTKNGHILIPVAGMDSVVVMAKSSKIYSYFDSGGQQVSVETRRFERSNILDVQALLKIKSYNSLTTLIQDEMPEILAARGPASINTGTAPLVLLDGNDIGTLTEANYSINVQSIKTIEWQKQGFGWGMRGANGVIIIKTR